LMHRKKLTFEEAYMLVTACGDLSLPRFNGHFLECGVYFA